MDMQVNTGRAWRLCALAALCALALWALCPLCPRASADEYLPEVYVEGVSHCYDDDGAVDTRPRLDAGMWDIAIGFSVNVAVPVESGEDGFIQRNLDRVHLYRADGSEVDGWYASVEGGGKRVIYIELEDWLDPLTEYQVVVDAGLEAADGSSAMAAEYRETFKTGAMWPDGLTVYQNAWIALGAFVVLAGIATQAVRVARRKR